MHQIYDREESDSPLVTNPVIAARLAQALDTIDDAFVALDHNWQILYQNRASDIISGKPGREVTGQSFWQAWSPWLSAPLKAELLRAMDEQVTVRLVHRILEPSQSESWFDIQAHPSPEGLNLFLKDITTDKKAEVVIREQEELLQIFIDNVPTCVAMFDRQMRYLMASQRWIDDYHLESIEAIMGRPHYEIFPEIPERWRQVYQRCLAGAIETCEADCFERQDGSQQWIRWEVRPWYRIDQAIGGVVVFAEDITEHKQAEVNLQTQQTRLRQQLAEIETIYQSAPIGLNVLDRDLRFVRINQQLADINGLPIEAHIGRTVRELLPDLADQAEALLRPILETGEPLLGIEISGKTPAQPGLQCTWIENFLPLKEGDRVIGISTVCQEVTELKRLEAERQQALVEVQQAKAHLEQRVAERTAELEQINADLRQRKSILRSFFNSATMPMGVVELHDNDILHLSDNWAAAEFLGSTPADMEYQFASQLGVSPATIECWSAYYKEAERTQSAVRFEYYHDAPSRGCWLAGSVCPIAFHPEEHPRFSYIAEDVTERRQAEEALASSEEQLRLALEFTHIGTWDWDVVTGNVIWNDNHFRLLGLESDSAAQDLYRIWRKAIHPEDVEQVEQVLLAALHNHTDYETEYRVIYPDGTVHWLVGRGRGLYDSAQNPIRMLGVIIDTSDRKQAEQLQEFQAVITRNMAEGICVVRADNGMIAYANRKFEQMFGYDPGELHGQHVSIVNYVTETMSAEDVNQSICTAVFKNQEATYEVHNVKKDGTPFWCSAMTSVFEHPDYGLVLVAVQQDITDKKEFQEKLQASLREKELLLKEIYHRVKNNLQVVHSLLDLQSYGVSDPAALTVLRDSQSRIRAMALVHEQLYKSADLTQINLADYVESLVYSLLDTYQATQGRTSLRIELAPCSLDIETALPCGLIFTELISNALKYAFPNNRQGEITVTSSVQPEGQITLKVQDNGIGLPEDFDFQQVSSLGLSLVRNLTKQIKGKVQVYSPAVGTAFQITFSP